jgi:hypothetical protein
MFEEPDEDSAERPADPATRAKDKSDEFRMHAEFAAVFEAHRKFDAELKAGLDGEVARDVQRIVGRLEKLRPADTPLIPPEAAPDAEKVLRIPETKNLSTGDYHIHRRPGEVMVVRWIAGEQVDTFYERLQAHFDAALKHFREEERQSLGWKQDPATSKYLEALDAVELKMSDRYLREVIRKHNVFILSTQSADELDILHLADVVMGVDPATIVGRKSAPPEDQPTESDRAWFFKLFSLRGIVDGQERMCFFTYLQKTDDSFDFE